MNKKFYIVIGAIFLMVNLAATTRASLLVSTTANSGAGSLRQAITDFNNDVSSTANTVEFSNLFDVPQTITLNSEILISGFGGALTINGPGANLLTIHMAGTDRIFRSNSPLTIKGMILEFGQGRGGGVNGKGSAIYFNGINSGGSLTLDKVIVQNNDSTSLTGSTGSVYFFGGTNHLITNSTFTGNTSGNCGAFDGVFANPSDTVTVVNSTISGNTVLNFGGGLCVSGGTTKFRSSTIAGNTATAGGGIFVQNGTLNLGNTIVAGNTGGSFPDFRFFGGTITTAGGNLIGNNSDVASTFPTGISPTADRSGDSATPLDALFAPLGNYGGTTPTRALCGGSPAIDNATNIFGETPTEDQRGGIRDNFFDIGAFEANASYVGVLPIGIVNQLYSQRITQNNSGFNYCVSSGALPPGLSGIPNCPPSLPNGLSSPQAAVTIAGTPTTIGTFSFAVTTTNGINSQTTNYQITITAPSASSGVVTGRIVDQNGNPVEGAVVRLEGTQNRKLITDADGFYRFDNVETSGFYTVTPSRANYTFSPSVRSFSQIGEATEAAFGATLASSGFVNPLDTPEYFVRQHYLDFLGREPDEAGFNFWSDQIFGCGPDFGCLERRRVNVSAAYFLSIEFQETGGLVDGLYRASYGRRPFYVEFLPDSAAIARDVVVGRAGWQQQLATNKQEFVDAWVQRAAFIGAYGNNLSNDGYVDQLIAHTGVSYTPGERDALVTGLTNATLTRAAVLRQIVENGSFIRAKSNQTFVMMQYFGYLRRDPDEDGYQFWLRKLNEFNGNFEQAEMVRAFLISGEYRQRFQR